MAAALHHRAPRTRLASKANVGQIFAEPKKPNVLGSPVFGAPLDPKSREVPPALVFIVSFIESKVRTVPGMLVTPPKYDEVLQYSGRMELGEISDHNDILNPFVVMEILKVYLKDLPEPVFTYQLYDPLMAINEALADASDLEVPQQLGYLKDLLRTLPYVNQLVTCYLISFFAWLANNFDISKTNHTHLAGIFGPYFLRPPRGISGGDYTTTDAVSLLSILIARAGQILPSLEGYAEGLALLNLQQSPLPGVDAIRKTSPKNKAKDPFASIRPGKRKTPATIRVKNFDYVEDEPTDGGMTALVTPHPEYVIEVPRRAPLKGPFKLIDAEMYEPLYQQILSGKDQIIYVALDVEFGPIVLCQEKISNTKVESIRCILFHSYGTESISAPPNCKKMSEMLKFVRTLYPSIPPQMKFSEINDSQMPNELLQYERKNMSKGAKFGVLFRRAGQTSEDDMFANNDVTHKGWQEFLTFLGDKIELFGFEGFRGGLDVKNRTTGTHSVYTKYGKTEIMFHVAPYLPWYPNDKQQLERKRHLGNDLVVVVFQEDESEFSPTWLTSEMNHVFIVITTAKDGWKMAIVSKKAVRTVEPHMPDPAMIPKNQLGRDFLLAKLLNVERATLHAPVFEKKLARTRRMLLENLIGESYSRRKAKMPKPTRPDSGARKSILPQITSLQRAKRASTSDVAEVKVLSTPEVNKPAISEPSLVSVTHSPTHEETDDLLTMASSKHVKKALAKRVDALYRDTDVTLMMARDLADADEEDIAAGLPAAPTDVPPTLNIPTSKFDGRQRAMSDAPAPKGHMRRPSNTPDPLQHLHQEAKKRVADILVRLNGYVDLCCKREMLERTMTLSKVLKACLDIVDRNVLEYNPSLLPPPSKLPEAVGLSLPQLKENCKKAAAQFSEKISGLLAVTLKLLSAYDSSPDSLKDLPAEKLIRDPARELAAAITSAPPPVLTKKAGNRMSGNQSLEQTPPPSPMKNTGEAQLGTPHKGHPWSSDSHTNLLETTTPVKTGDAPSLPRSDSKSMPPPQGRPSGAGNAPLTRSLTDLKMVQERLVLAMQRTEWKLVCLHRLMRDGHVTQANAALILAPLSLHGTAPKTFIEAANAFVTLKKEVNEALSLGDITQAQVRLVEATKATKGINAALDAWFMTHPFEAPPNTLELAEANMRLCSDRLRTLCSAMLKTGVSAVANRCTRLFRSLTKFLATREELVIPPPAVDASGVLMTDAQQRALAELMEFLIDEVQSKLHALVHHIRSSSSDPNRKWEAVTQLEALERVAGVLEAEIQALTAPPTRPLPATPTGAPALPSSSTTTSSSGGGISEEELERLRNTLSYSAELAENSIEMVESLTRQCQSLQLATALAALAVLLKKLRAGETNLNLKAVRVETIADAGTLTQDQTNKLEYIRKLATSVFADTRVFMLTMSAEITSSNSAPELLGYAKLVANVKKALDDFVATNSEYCLPGN